MLGNVAGRDYTSLEESWPAPGRIGATGGLAPLMSLETKYVAPAACGHLLLQRLKAVCKPDPRFRTNHVHSVYFDTADFDAMSEVENGDYYKTKVRIRWYESGPRSASGAFLESKCKIGRRRDKRRIALPDSFRGDLPLEDPAWRRYPPLLAREGAPVPGGELQPSLHVTYRRHRFVEPTTGLRLSLDDTIRLPRVHQRLASVAAVVRRPAAWIVFETKGDQRQLPPTLLFIHDFGARRRAFSKYGLWRGLLRNALQR